MTIRYASTFISHSSVHKELAADLARELNRRGVVPWLDVQELCPGERLDQALSKGVAAQETLTALISHESVRSYWCRHELEPLLANDDRIIPVFLGDPLTLVQASPQLSQRWLTPDGRHVCKLGMVVGDAADADVGNLAARIATEHFRRLGTSDTPKLTIILDQRGNGRRVGRPGAECVPPNWTEQLGPALVFRPDGGERTIGTVLHGTDWHQVRDALWQSLSSAATTRRRQVYVTGNAQMALAWLVGSYFDRSSLVHLFVNSQSSGQVLAVDFSDDRFRMPLPFVDPAQIRWHGSEPAPDCAAVSVYLGAPAYLPELHALRSKRDDASPLAIRETVHIRDARQVIDLASWLGAAGRNRKVRVYTSLPFHAVVLLAALLKHTTGHVTIMDWDDGRRTYRACAMPR